MKLSLLYGYGQSGPRDRFIELAERAEALGFDSVFTAESYGSDVFTPLAAIASRTKKIKLGTGVMQISARTPAMAAMTATMLDHISGGRLLLGVGVSGPQVIEGWHGQPFARPLERMREWITLFRKLIAREEPVTFEGKHYQLPYTGPGSTGRGKPLKLITHPIRKHIPLLLGAEGPKSIELAFTEFDGLMPLLLPPDHLDIVAPHLPTMKPGFELIPPLIVGINDDFATAALPAKRFFALNIGGMGHKEENYHRNFLTRMGFGEEAQRIQELFLAGRKEEAVQAVTDELVDRIALVGSKSHIRERLKAYKKSPITTMGLFCRDTFEETVEMMEFFANELL